LLFHCSSTSVISVGNVECGVVLEAQRVREFKNRAWIRLL